MKLLLLLLLSPSLCAASHKPLLSTPTPSLPQVNLATGELALESTDLCISSAQPLNVRRYYNHTHGCWRFNPESTLFANFEQNDLPPCFVSVGRETGGVCFLEKTAMDTFRFNPKQLGYFHSGSGSDHPSNLHLTYHKVFDTKNSSRFSFEGELTDGTGATMTFSSGMHCWNSQMLCHNIITLEPSFWTPFQLRVKQVRCPNGNYICYTYRDLSKRRDTPQIAHLSKITTYNNSKSKVLSELTFKYQIRTKPKSNTPVQIKRIDIEGSDGRRASYIYGDKDFKSLKTVSANGTPQKQYTYDKEGRITSICMPEGRFLRITYENNKVCSLIAPAGADGEHIPIQRYVYGEGETTVYDAHENRKVYRFDQFNRIRLIETYENNAVVRIDENIWDAISGHLITSKVLDGNKTCLEQTHYTYDAFHNVTSIEKENTLTQRRYSQEGMNLLVWEQLPSGQQTYYNYLPNTNLLTSSFVMDGQKRVKRTFNTYDDTAVCIKHIVDDGSGPSQDDLTDVSYRLITEITPTTEPPFGLPRQVEEKTIDQSGHERSLHKIAYTYTPFGAVLTQTHYDSNNNLAYSIENQYEGELLVKTIDAIGAEKSFAYDANQNTILAQGPLLEHYIETRYDLVNRPTTIIDSADQIRELSYDTLGNIISETNADGFTLQHTYDNASNRISTLFPNGGQEICHYDLFGNCIRKIDPLGFETKTTYNHFGKPTLIEYPDGSFESFTYNSDASVAEKKTTDGAVVRYSYNIFGEVTEEQTYLKGVVQKSHLFERSAFTLLSKTDPCGVVTSYSYDFAGRKTMETCHGRKIYFGYDPLGRLTHTQIDDLLHVEDFDLLGRLIKKRDIDLSGRTLTEESFSYDAANNCIAHTCCGGVSKTEYDAHSRPILKIDPLGHKQSFSYGEASITTTDPKGTVTTVEHNFCTSPIKTSSYDRDGKLLSQAIYSYDLGGNCLKKSYPLQNVSYKKKYGVMGRIEQERDMHYLFDEKGRLKTKIKADGTELTSQYDGLGRVTRFFGPDFDYRYTYDGCDRIIAIFDETSGQCCERFYDYHGNLISEKLGNNLTLSSNYSPCSERTMLTLPDQTSINYTYLFGKLYRIHRGNFDFIYAARDLANRPTQLILPAHLGILTTRRDPLGRYTSLNSPFFTTKLTYDACGNLIQDGEHRYSYDDLKQLSKADDQTYRFDELANALTLAGGSTTIDSYCRLIEDGQHNYTYDLNGNLLSDGTNYFHYDSLDRLIQITTPEKTISYQYDPFNRRISEDNHRLFIWDGQNEIGCMEDGRIKELRLLGEGLGAEIGASLLYEIEGTSYLPIHDHRGSLINLVNLTDPSQQEHYTYSPFGKQLNESTTSPWRFASKRVEQTTGLIYFGSRYYNPQMQRWITPDPAGDLDGPNLYAYVLNNPLSNIDLYGLFSNPYAGVQSAGGLIMRTAYPLFKAIELTGQHLIPFRGVRDLVEGIGRFGCGGRFSDPATYRRSHDSIHVINGIQSNNEAHIYKNGIMTSENKAIQQTRMLSQKLGGEQVILHYKATKGLSSDLLEWGAAKLGIGNPYERMSVSHVQSTLTTHKQCHIYAHSKGGTHLANEKKLFSAEERSKIHVKLFGSASTLPPDSFASTQHYFNIGDLFAATANLGSYFYSPQSPHINLLPPRSWNPLKEHSFFSYSDLAHLP